MQGDFFEDPTLDGPLICLKVPNPIEQFPVFHNN